jgi:hypothetical protein
MGAQPFRMDHASLILTAITVAAVIASVLATQGRV